MIDNEKRTKWVPAYSYDLNNSFTMDSVLGNTYKPLKATPFNTNARYCFINEQDLLNQLINVGAKLSNDISLAIRQTEKIDLIYALVKDITYNSLNKHYDFVFEMDNPLSDQDINQLVIEVPKSALKGVELNQVKNVLISQIYNRATSFGGDGQ